MLNNSYRSAVAKHAMLHICYQLTVVAATERCTCSWFVETAQFRDGDRPQTFVDELPMGPGHTPCGGGSLQ